MTRGEFFALFIAVQWENLGTRAIEEAELVWQAYQQSTQHARDTREERK
jgi:hypothetical protein